MIALLSECPPPISVTNSGEEVHYCPLCPEATGSPDRRGHLHVDPQRGVYFCFRCSQGGSTRQLRKVTGIDWPLGTTAEGHSRESVRTAQDVVRQAFRLPPGTPDGGRQTTDYALLSRQAHQPYTYSEPFCRAGGLGPRSALFVLGRLTPREYAAGDVATVPPLLRGPVAAALQTLRHRGVTCQQALLAGLAVTGSEAESLWRCRIVFPSPGQDGYYDHFRARTLGLPWALPNVPKYLGPRESQAAPSLWWAPRAHELVRSQTLLASEAVVLVEGPFDALAVERVTAHPAVALCGKAASAEALRCLLMMAPEATGWIVLLDSEAQRDALRTVQELQAVGARSVQLGRLSQGDPADVEPEVLRAALGDSEAPPSFAEYVIARVSRS